MLQKANLSERCAALTDYWSPAVVGEVNDQYIKVAKVKGEFDWHQHDSEDELFLVLRGELTIAYEGQHITLTEGDMHVVPKGRLHCPHAKEECWIALVETKTTRHTGDLVTEKTRSIEEQLGPNVP